MTQKQALALLKTGANVFLTGEAGSGKTHTINDYTAYLREHEIDYAVTASTGIAATHIHGMTLHSWSGIGIETSLDQDTVKHIAENRYAAKRIKRAQVLIVDEVSMLDGTVLSLVERVCRKVRKSQRAFGGLQVVLVGDFFQLPPVSSSGRTVEFAFDSEAWQVIAPTVCYLTEQHRQEDGIFLDLLAAIRRNDCDETHVEVIRERLTSLEELPDDMTRLFPHNKNVDTINISELKKLPGKSRVFLMAARGPATLSDALIRGCISPERLELKEGAVVMFTKNNPQLGFVNGTLGSVIGFDSVSKYPLVETHEGRRILVEPMEWSISEGDEVLAKITQLPLKLAWAMTIHKSQGVSLDAAVMDLSQAFEFGQGYVALSRVRRLSGVHLLGINQRALEVHPVVLEKDQEFHLASRLAEKEWQRLPEERLHDLEKQFIVRCGGKIKKGPKVKKAKPEKKTTDQGPAPVWSVDALREKYVNAYRAWEPKEEKRLRNLFEEALPIKEIADMLGRQPGSIRSRLKKLELL